MIMIVDERETIAGGYVSCFGREGISATGLCPGDFESWVRTASPVEMHAVEAILLGDYEARCVMPRLIKGRSQAAVIALNDEKSLQDTLDLFAAGVDDVVRKPVHVREILARIKAIQGRIASSKNEAVAVGRIKVFSDGRDPEVDGMVLTLPRRERRILEFLAGNSGRLVSKAQIFNSVYGLFDKDVDENVIESHISKLRKRLRHQLGFDAIESKRFLGYRLVCFDARARPDLHNLEVA